MLAPAEGGNVLNDLAHCVVQLWLLTNLVLVLVCQRIVCTWALGTRFTCKQSRFQSLFELGEAHLEENVLRPNSSGQLRLEQTSLISFQSTLRYCLLRHYRNFD